MGYHEKLIAAETMAAKWLAEGNAAFDAGNPAKAEECYQKSQYWLDRANNLLETKESP